MSAKQPATRPSRRRRTPAASGVVDPRFALVAAAFAANRRVSRRKMFSSDSVLSVDGKIFAMLARGKLVVKLAKDRVDALVRAGMGERFDPGRGRLMNEWIAIGPGPADWVTLAKEAHRYVRGGGRS